MSEIIGLDPIAVGKLASFFDFEEDGNIKYPIFLRMIENNNYIADFLEEYFNKGLEIKNK
jgi:hypothetical protein